MLVAGPQAGIAAPQDTANPYDRGPDPTETSLVANGPYAVATTTVSRTWAGSFGGGTIYYPTSTAEGTFGAVAVSPGYTATQSSVSWYGPRLASHGFVVITIDTRSRYDQPIARGDQLLAALDYLTQRSTVRSRIDASRLAVMGHSMGGGGALEATKDRPALQASIPLTAYNTDKTWPEVTTPTLLIGAESDTIAPVARHSEPFYASLPATTPKAYAEIAGASHSVPTRTSPTISRYSIAWLKRFVDDDVRYQRFLCPAVGTSALSEYRATCTW